MEKKDIEKLLKDGKTIQLEPRGYSMYPMLVPGRDMVILQSAGFDEIRRGSVVLYRRDQSILVLHRVWKKRENTFYMVGDNQTSIEGPLRADQVRGILVGFVRNGHSISVKNPIYQLYAGVWLILRPFRSKIAGVVHRIRTRGKNKNIG